MFKILPIMPALCPMPVGTYYAHNYAGIIGSGLLTTLCSPLGNILQTAEKLPLYNLEGNFIYVMFVIKASMLICCMIVIGNFTFTELHF